MAIEIRTATDDDWPAFAYVDARNFGFGYTETDLADARPVIDTSRFVLAVDGREIVGVAGSYAFDITMPGGTTVPMGGVTWVSTSATHRRQGVLTRMMQACHDDIDARGEPVAALFASESGIYERFGYGMATVMVDRRIDTRRVAVQQRFRPPPGTVRFLEADEARVALPPLWERFRRTRAGELSRSPAWFERMFTMWSRPRDGASVAFFLGHADGYAVYRVTMNWNEGFPCHELRVLELVAVTAEAHVALWDTVLTMDLVGTVVTRQSPLDDPLPYLLDDFRAWQTVGLTDGLWVNVRDVTTAFGARAYGTADRFVVEVSDGALQGRRVAIEGGPDGGTCRVVRSRPDLTVGHGALGALLYGGISASTLAAGRRLTARLPDVLRRADHFFGTTPLPSTLTFF